MRKITTDQLFDLLRNDTNGRFYSVTFQRRTSTLTKRAGELRTMLCRTAGPMKSYKRGVVPTAVRDAEDLRTGTLTVWSMDSYMANKRRGMAQEPAAYNAWRRIDLMGIKECSLVDDGELPPTYRPALHEVRNEFRQSHMPRIAIGA